MIRHIHIHIQIFIGDLLFKGDQHLTHCFFQIKVNLLIITDAALILQAGDIQHAAHQTAQPLCFIGDDLQIIAVAILRNGTIKNAVDIAGDGGHGGLQFVGYICYKFLALIFTLLQLLRHIVKGQRQLFHFLRIILRQSDAGIQITMTKGTGNGGHLLQRFTLSFQNEQHGNKANTHNQQGNHHKNIGDFRHDGGGIIGRTGNHHDAKGKTCGIVLDQGGNHEAGFVVKLRDSAGGHIAAIFQHLGQIAVAEPQTLMAASGEHLTAKHYLTINIEDNGIGTGNTGSHV